VEARDVTAFVVEVEASDGGANRRRETELKFILSDIQWRVGNFNFMHPVVLANT
jgi:hypothetical protein